MQKPAPTKRHRTLLEIRHLLARFLRSGVSQLQFARNEGVCLSTLRRYLKRFPGSDTGVPPGAPPPLSVRFLEVEDPGASRSLPALAPNPQQQSPFRLTFAGGSVLEIPAGSTMVFARPLVGRIWQHAQLFCFNPSGTQSTPD